LARRTLARNKWRPSRRPLRCRHPRHRRNLQMTRLRCAILDDYFKLSLTTADWSKIKDRVELTVFEKPFKSQDDAAAALRDFEIILAMRERTAFPKAMFAALPKLKLLITSGMR